MQKIGELPVTAGFTMSKSRDVLEKNLERFLRLTAEASLWAQDCPQRFACVPKSRYSRGQQG
jgi:hypothetical protein